MSARSVMEEYTGRQLLGPTVVISPHNKGQTTPHDWAHPRRCKIGYVNPSLSKAAKLGEEGM